MQKDVKIGLIVGVVILALIVVVWVRSKSGDNDNSEVALNDVQSDMGATTGLTSDSSAAAATGTTGINTAQQPATQGALAAIPTPPVTAPQERTHKVAQGDSLWKIAEMYYGSGAKAKLIADANHIDINAKLKIGQELIIPAEPAASAATPPATTAVAPTMPTTPTMTIPSEVRKHKVVKGDTLEGLAIKYYNDRKKAKDIAEANSITLTTTLKLGQELIIP